VLVDTGKGGNTAAHRCQGRSWYVRNNDKDTAALLRSSGGTVDTCSYNSTHVAYTMCWAAAARCRAGPNARTRPPCRQPGT
jgi:hypothetical protein